MCRLSLLQGLFNPGIEPKSPTLQTDSLPAEPQGKPLQQKEDVNHLQLREHVAPGLLEQRTDNANPWDTPCYPTVCQSENCAQADHRPRDPQSHLAFKSALPKPLGELGAF